MGSSRRIGTMVGAGHRSLAVLAGIVLASALTGSAAAAQDPVTFRVGITQAPSESGLNPYQAVLASDYTLYTDQYDLLVEFGPNLEPAPGLAESWEVSEDGLTWTWHIRPGVTWSDGQPFTAEDARFQIQYIIDSHDPAYVGPQAPDGNDLPDESTGEVDGVADNPLSLFDSYLDLDGGFDSMRITSVTAPDDATLVITTSEPIATLAQMFIPMLPKHVWEGITFLQAQDPITLEQSVGTGPFKLVQFDPKQAVVLEARDDYWGGAPKVDELVYQFFDNDEAQVNALISGEVDFLDNFPATLASRLQGAQGVTTNIAASSDFGELGFNSWAPTPERFELEGCADCPKGPTTGSLGDPWLTRPDVRAAVAGLIDKPALVQFAQSGFADPGVSVVSPYLNATFGYTPPADDPVSFPAYTDEASQDAARATAEQRFRDAMAAIGFTDTDGDGILNVPSDDASVAFDPEGAGANWSLRLFVREDDEEDKLAAELMEQWFEAAGIDIDYQPISEDALTDAVYPYASNADTDLFIWGWGPDPDPDFILGVFTCAQINNWGDANTCDPAYDAEYRAQRSQVDLAERAATVLDLQDKLYHESPYAVLWYANTLEAYRSDRWTGFQATPTGGALWSTYGFGPYGSRTTVQPVDAAS
ncbi:MAG: ABC transporter substrate-binding protein [Chloroflexota bacterium]